MFCLDGGGDGRADRGDRQGVYRAGGEEGVRRIGTLRPGNATGEEAPALELSDWTVTTTNCRFLLFKLLNGTVSQICAAFEQSIEQGKEMICETWLLYVICPSATLHKLPRSQSYHQKLPLLFRRTAFVCACERAHARLDGKPLDLVPQGADLAGKLAALVGVDGRGDDGAADAEGAAEGHLGGHVDVGGALVLAEQGEVQEDAQRGRVGGQDGNLADAAVEGLGDCLPAAVSSLDT